MLKPFFKCKDEESVPYKKAA